MNGATLIAELGYVGMILALLAPCGRKWWPLLPIGVIGVTVMSGLPGVLRAVFGDPGAALMVASLWLVYRSACGHLTAGWREVAGLLRIVCVVSLPLYLGSLSGVGPDLYALGFGSGWLVVCVGLAGCLAVFAARWHVALWIVSALLLAAVDLGESSNLWDCLVDLPAVLAGLACWVAHCRFSLRQGKKECSVGSPS